MKSIQSSSSKDMPPRDTLNKRDGGQRQELCGANRTEDQRVSMRHQKTSLAQFKEAIEDLGGLTL